MAGERSDNLFAPGGPFAGLEIVSGFPDPEKRRLQDLSSQQEFMGFIEKLRSPQVLALPDLSEQLDHETKRTVGLDVPLSGQGDRVFLSPGFYDHLEHSKFPNRLTFRPQPLMRIGRENSYQQVFFGTLKAEWFHEADQENLQIAVKPIPHREISEERLLHEVAMYQHIGKLGLPTLEVLGVCMLDEPRSKIDGFVVTRFDPDIVTMDNLPWEDMSSKDRDEAVGLAMDTMAILHSQLIFHGDPEFKNIALGEAQKSITVVDVERATSAAGVPERVKRIAQMMCADFSDVEKSFGEYIFPNLPLEEKPQDDIERFNLFHNMALEPFFERLVHIDSPYLDVLAKAYEIMVDVKARMARGEDFPRDFWAY